MRETVWAGVSSERDADRQALTACLKMFIDGTCLLAFLFLFRSSVLASRGLNISLGHQVWTSIVGNLEMTLLENNFYFNKF